MRPDRLSSWNRTRVEAVLSSQNPLRNYRTGHMDPAECEDWCQGGTVVETQIRGEEWTTKLPGSSSLPSVLLNDTKSSSDDVVHTRRIDMATKEYSAGNEFEEPQNAISLPQLGKMTIDHLVNFDDLLNNPWDSEPGSSRANTPEPEETSTLDSSSCESDCAAPSDYREALRFHAGNISARPVDGDVPSWADYGAQELALLCEDFVDRIAEERERCWNGYMPRMPSPLNPRRTAAPPFSWYYLERPYKFAHNWSMKRNINTIPVRSRSACEISRRYLPWSSSTKHCRECQRDTTVKLLLSARAASWKSPSRTTRRPPDICSLATSDEDGSDCSPASSSSSSPSDASPLYNLSFVDDGMDFDEPLFLPKLRVIQPEEFEDYSESDDSDDAPMDEENIAPLSPSLSSSSGTTPASTSNVDSGETLIETHLQRGLLTSENLMRDEFQFDYYQQTGGYGYSYGLASPRAPRLRDLDEFSEDSDETLMEYQYDTDDSMDVDHGPLVCGGPNEDTDKMEDMEG
ncbi:hypothetical protein FA15DRAFT_754010 [Coprinopsis marcescibilis]|uniref:Uncharacterized protein n=1 Tax=Coprinopsis marcescibilis TaxID=230819 RepID=A0A5C3L5C0_COPMA|nr:hypothetical protein FA15DRAFT_754010 [Coprinopsis marcescibilis]